MTGPHGPRQFTSTKCIFFGQYYGAFVWKDLIALPIKRVLSNRIFFFFVSFIYFHELFSYFFHELFYLILLHSERPKLYTILAFLSAIGLNFHLIANGNL